MSSGLEPHLKNLLKKQRRCCKMRSEIPVRYEDDSRVPTKEDKLDNKAKTSLRERSMKSENNYPGIER